jgi:hypothetical protein
VFERHDGFFARPDWRGTRSSSAAPTRSRRVPFDSHGRLAPILKRRASLRPNAYVFGSAEGEFVASFKTVWNRCCRSRTDTTRSRPSLELASDREKPREIDFPWYDLRREGARRLLADSVDIRVVQSIRGRSDIKTKKRYLNTPTRSCGRHLRVCRNAVGI